MISVPVHFRFLLIVVALFCLNQTVPAQTASVAIDWKALADSTLGKSVHNGEIPGAAVLVVNRDETIYTAGFGVSRLDTGNPVTGTTLFEVGSIGKVLSAIAVLQQVERGHLNLSEDINAYLTDWQVETPDNKPLTLHHLLTHSGGLNERAIGYAARQPDHVASLGKHLSSNFPPFFVEPSRYISYSNYGFGLAGYAVEEVTQTPFVTYVSTEILSPLGIQASGYQPGEAADLAAGYRKEGDKFVSVPALYRPVTPAGSFVANTEDMGRLLHALLNDGAPVLTRLSVGRMMEVQKSMHPALMGNGYGLEESRWSAIRGFGKGGSIPGFFAYMALLPEQGLGLFVAVNGPSDSPIDQFVLAAMNELSSDPGAAVLPVQPVDLSPFVGEYRSNRYDRTSIEKLLNFEVHQIYATSDGNLTMWHDGAMNVYRPVEAALFQHARNPNRLLFFEVDERGQTTHAFFNDRMAGGYVPVVWEKNGFWNSNLYVNEYFGFVLIFSLSYLFLPLIALVGWIVRCRREGRQPYPRILWWMNGMGFLTSVLVLAYTVFYFLPLLQSRPELVFGLPEALANWAILPWVIVTGFAAFAVLWMMSLLRTKRGWLGPVFGFFYLISGVLVCEFFLRWNLI